MDKIKISVRDVFYLGGIACSLAVSWGSAKATAMSQQKEIDDLKSQVADLREIKGNLLVLTEVAQDSRKRLVRIENRLFK